MSHEIEAYVYRGDTLFPIFEMRRAGLDNPLRHVIYRLLGAEEFDAGCSGVGNGRWFTQEEIKAAIARLPAEQEAEQDDLERERLFLERCSAEPDVYIDFS
jgi:Fe-S oxidoreductase